MSAHLVIGVEDEQQEHEAKSDVQTLSQIIH